MRLKGYSQHEVEESCKELLPSSHRRKERAVFELSGLPIPRGTAHQGEVSCSEDPVLENLWATGKLLVPRVPHHYKVSAFIHLSVHPSMHLSIHLFIQNSLIQQIFIDQRQEDSLKDWKIMP